VGYSLSPLARTHGHKRLFSGTSRGEGERRQAIFFESHDLRVSSRSKFIVSDAGTPNISLCPPAEFCSRRGRPLVKLGNDCKRYAKPLLTLAKVLSPFTPQRQSAAPALQPKLQASVPQSSSSWPRADV
jgi:hypothetical protein